MGATIEAFPGLATILTAPEPAVRTAAADLPEGAMGLPDGGVEDARIGAVDAQVNRTGFVADKQYVSPVGAAIVAFEHATFRIGAEGVTQCRHPHDVRVVRVDADLADVARITQPAVGPAPPGVGTAVDAVAMGDVDTDGRFAGTSVDDVRVGRRNRQRADRGCGEEAIGHGLPVGAAIGCLPDAAGHRAEVVGMRLLGAAGHGDHPTATKRTNASPPEQSFNVELPCISHLEIPSPLRLRLLPAAVQITGTGTDLQICPIEISVPTTSAAVSTVTACGDNPP